LKKSHSILYFMETSAKSGENVERLFVDTAKFLYLKYKDKLHQLQEEERTATGSFQGKRPTLKTNKRRSKNASCQC